VGSSNRELTALDELFLQRTYELAARAMGDTAPNPPVGAVVVREGRLVGEGYHHRAGEAHAETRALRQAGASARGATLYISLEPCRHTGRTPPCTHALLEAGVARVVAGTVDPSEHGGGLGELRERGVEVALANDARARDLIESFAQSAGRDRPYVALKMAMSLDGMVAPHSGIAVRLGSAEEVRYVRALRTIFDAVMVGAGTVRIDDPQLTVRPAHDRARPYVRVVVCESEAIAPASRVLAAQPGYARTIVLVPAARHARFETLQEVAEVIAVGSSDATRIDLVEAMKTLRARGIYSVLCEGGPKLAASLLAADLIDRVYWAITPRLLGTDGGVPVLRGADVSLVRLRFDSVQMIGPDVIISGTRNV
jgi:diaminohydroxyphosphoribosylaminopyrimidine deaminase/5-amino-6-(5-phosphoribosylamino)uracil reductase